MSNNYAYIKMKIPKIKGDDKMNKENQKLMKEIYKVYRNLNLSKKTLNLNKVNNSLAKKMGICDNSKKSYLDNKTTVKVRYSYYG